MFFRRLGAIAFVCTLGGCIAVGDVDRRATTINEEVGTTQNRALLLNLVRASNEEPIYFTSMSQLAAGGTTEFRASAPQFFAGPHLPPPDQIASFDGTGTFLDNQTNSSFQMSMLDTKDFYAGLMAPVSLTDVDLLLHQGYARELIFYLVIDKATITAPGDGAPTVVRNDPNGPTFELFKYYIKQAMEHGLTTETYEAPGPASDDASKQVPTTYAELCYDKALALPEDRADIAPASFCGARPSTRTAASDATGGLMVTLHDPGFALHDQPLQVDVTMRSINGIFYYLGRIVRSGKEVDLQPFNLPAETIAQAPLIQVNEGAALAVGADGCFTQIGYEGATYCVPRRGADNTKHIFGILNALLALKQSVSDQLVTPTVRIQQ
jgi:hypothetical protein